MEIVNIKKNSKYLAEYFKLCSLEWGAKKSEKEITDYVQKQVNNINFQDKIIIILGLIDGDVLKGFISLYKYDGDERMDLTPWYATMYVKKEYRGCGYSKILNDALLEEARLLGYSKIYLKSDLKNYYEKFGAKYIEKLKNGENLYYINCDSK